MWKGRLALRRQRGRVGLGAALKSRRNKTVGHDKIMGRERIRREVQRHDATCVLRERTMRGMLELEIVPRAE
jgi:hypothetical protein